MKIVKFITYKESEGKEDNGLGGLGGFFQKGMRWADYVNHFQDDYIELLEIIRIAIIKKGIRCTGDQHQHTNYKSVPLWDNGKVDTYSYRAWGDLMAAVWSTADNIDYSYMDFYM